MSTENCFGFVSYSHYGHWKKWNSQKTQPHYLVNSIVITAKLQTDRCSTRFRFETRATTLPILTNRWIFRMNYNNNYYDWNCYVLKYPTNCSFRAVAYWIAFIWVTRIFAARCCCCCSFFSSFLSFFLSSFAFSVLFAPSSMYFRYWCVKRRMKSNFDCVYALCSRSFAFPYFHTLLG